MQVSNFEQNSPEWHQARSGIITASAMKDVLAKGQGKTRNTYMNKLVAEIITGQPTESFSNVHTDRGHEQELDVLEIYKSVTDEEVKKVGFIRNHEDLGGVGYSPDCLIGEEGVGEIKTRLPHLQVELLLAKRVPPEHKAQIQCGLWVSERKWCDFVCYCPSMPLFKQRVERDEAYIETMKSEVEKFYMELKQKLEAIKGA